MKKDWVSRLTSLKEIWLDVPELEEFAMVSNFGRIYLKTSDKITWGTITVGVPYCRVKINGKSYLTHRLQCIAFRANPKKKRDVNHDDGDTYHNVISNLDWATRSENVTHSYRVLGRKRMKGENSPLSKLSDTTRHNIKAIYATGKYLQKDIAQMFGVAQNTVSRIIIN